MSEEPHIGEKRATMPLDNTDVTLDLDKMKRSSFHQTKDYFNNGFRSKHRKSEISVHTLDDHHNSKSAVGFKEKSIIDKIMFQSVYKKSTNLALNLMDTTP